MQGAARIGKRGKAILQDWNGIEPVQEIDQALFFHAYALQHLA
jgi:hypothetical protein